MPPVIGIPLSLDDRGRWHTGRDYQYIHAAYGDAVAAAGGIPLYLPFQADAQALVDRLDGLLVPGGDDFAPPTDAAYPADVTFNVIPAAQITFDDALIGAALARNLPVLGICYGMQLLTLHHGGTLLYHIPTDVPDAAAHRLPEADGRHGVRLEPGTHLAAFLAQAPRETNSLHHQGIREPGAGLRVCARADDGVIEAVERPDTPFCIGVQWHPEKMTGPHCADLFAAFVTACADGPRS